MEFDKLISVAGHSSLFEILSRTKFGLVAKSLENQKKIPIYQSQQVSSLQDISMFTYEGEIALREVFIRLLNKFEGKPALGHKANIEELKAAFESVVPDFDKERVRDGDLKKCFRWYNQMVEHGLTDPEALKKDSESSKSESTEPNQEIPNSEQAHTEPNSSEEESQQEEPNASGDENPNE